MKKLFLGAAMAAILWASTPQAFAGERGGWLYIENLDAPERLELEYSDGSIIVLAGIEDSCGGPGDSYKNVRKILTDNGKRQRISWKIQQQCGNLAKICVTDKFLKKACSAYEVLSLKSWDAGNPTWQFNLN
jgi:hypothetical protein